MMQELIDTLHTEQCSLAILHEGNIRTFDGHGVRRLYNIINDEPELFLDAKVAVKAVGRSAARMMKEGNVAEVYADVISQQAYDVLHDAGIAVSFEKRVDHATFLRIWQKLGELEKEPKTLKTYDAGTDRHATHRAMLARYFARGKHSYFRRSWRAPSIQYYQ